MKSITLIIFFTSMSHFCISQAEFVSSEKYMNLISIANKFYDNHNFLQSGNAYDAAFKSKNGKGLKRDLYNAACSWALANNKNKSFFYLNALVKDYKWSDSLRMSNDSDLVSLQSDNRWQPLIQIVMKNIKEKDSRLNKPLVAILDTILKEDQDIRLKFIDQKNIYRIDTAIRNSVYKTWEKIDSINLSKVENIISKYGWLGPDEVGENGQSALFLVIQHASLNVQLKYLPLMREAVKKGKARRSDLALLEDRVLMYQGKEQIYGSQLKYNKTGGYEFHPIKDEVNVNKRRASMNL